MLFNTISLTLFASAVSARPSDAWQTFGSYKFSKADVIQRDVAIVGGGSSGTYSALSLKDKNISSIVIEAKDRIGGHTETYIDPVTGAPIDYGVLIFHNDDIVKKYFGRFNIPLITVNPSANAVGSATYDYKSGNLVTPKQYTQQEVGAALQKYAQVIAQWPQLDAGMFLPEPVPEDLTLPMGAFAAKYGIEAAIPTMANYNPGTGDFLSLPVVENIRIFGLSLIQSFQTGFLTSGNNSALYTAAQAELLASKGLLLNSWVAKAKRTENGVQLAVQTSEGLKLIIAKRLLVTIPVKLDSLGPFDLSKTEKSIFGKFKNGAYYTSVMKNTGLPPNVTVFNGLQQSAYNLPAQPGIVNGQVTPNPNLHTVYYSGPRGSNSAPYSDEFVKSEIIASLKKLQQVNPTVFPQSEPEFVKFSSHTPFYLQVCASDIKAGFYKSLYALQGGRSTFFTGASWKGQDSTSLWKYTEGIVLPGLIKSLQAKQ